VRKFPIFDLSKTDRMTEIYAPAIGAGHGTSILEVERCITSEDQRRMNEVVNAININNLSVLMAMALGASVSLFYECPEQRRLNAVVSTRIVSPKRVALWSRAELPRRMELRVTLDELRMTFLTHTSSDSIGHCRPKEQVGIRRMLDKYVGPDFTKFIMARLGAVFDKMREYHEPAEVDATSSNESEMNVNE
jgi:hypothetical protein